MEKQILSEGIFCKVYKGCDSMYENFGYGYPNGQMGISPTKQSIKDYVCLMANCSSVDMVDEFDTLKARHICQGSKVISLLSKDFIPVPTTKGMINVEVFFCPMCRKLIINKASMEVY